MSEAARAGYFQTLAEDFGQAWNRFWFSASDPYPLGCIRLAAGLLLLYAHLTWTYDLTRFFAADGMVNVETAERLRSLQGRVETRQLTPIAFSYLNYAGSPSQLWTLHGLGLVVIVLFTAGLKTRVTSVLTLLVWLSYYHRAPVLAGEMEPILSFILFYLCLGPSGAALSVDRWLEIRKERELLRVQNRENDPIPPHAASWQATIPLRLMQIHLSVVFLMMALAKLSGPNPPAVWWTGDGVWWLLTKPQTRPFDMTGIAEFGQARLLIDSMTHAWVWFELAFGLLVWNQRARPLMLGLLVVLWGTLVGLTTGLFVFVLALFTAGLSFYDAGWLRRMAGKVLPQDIAA